MPQHHESLGVTTKQDREFELCASCSVSYRVWILLLCPIQISCHLLPRCLWTPVLTMQREDSQKVLTEMWSSKHNDSKSQKAWRIYIALPHQYLKTLRSLSVTHFAWLLNITVWFVYQICYIFKISSFNSYQTHFLWKCILGDSSRWCKRLSNFKWWRNGFNYYNHNG